ncbi:MAG: hypothetical protein WA624_01500 [Methylocella sp.]
MRAFVNLFNEVMRFNFNGRYKALYDASDRSIETLDVADISAKLKDYFGSYRDAQNHFRLFLQGSGADLNKDELLTRWLAADSRALGALRDLKSFPQGKMLEEKINEGFFQTRSGSFANYTRSAK